MLMAMDSTDLLVRVKELKEMTKPQETMVEIGAGIWADARM
jgi:hypothetical protein